MGTEIGGGIYIIMGFISLNLIFSGFPTVGKCELISSKLNGTAYTNGLFPQQTLFTETCVIPNLFYSDPAKNNHTHFPNDIEVCPNSQNRLLNNNQQFIWVVYRNLLYYNATNDELFRCCYKPFQLAVNVTDEGKANKIQYEDCILFNDTISICHEFVRVFCYYNTSIIYDQLFAFVITDPQFRATKYETDSEEYIPEPAQTKLPYNGSFNVILLGISSMSRLNFQRTMPKTFNILKDKDTIDFFGYNRFGNTKLDNILPALLGKTITEMNKNCKIQGDTKTREKKDCPFIWEHFKQRGYNTALVEDSTAYSISSYFDSSPTDYYFNPFTIESEQIEKEKHPDFCTGDKYTYKIMVGYMEQLCKSFQTSKLFGLFWQSSLTSLGFNYPIVTDNDYEILFRNINENGYLNRTILIILSDRGSKYGSSRENYLEERLPLLKLVLPPSFRDRYKLAYNNLLTNSQRLVTTLDLHATLLDLVNVDAIRDEEILIRNEENYASDRSISLFVPIPANRTCSMANLANDQCTCYKRSTIKNLSSLTAEYASRMVIPKINKIIAPYPQCRRLSLKYLVAMSMITAPYMKENRWIEYMMRVKAYPEGTFDAVLRLDHSWYFVALINRLDYDEQKSYCVDDPFVKIYCICKPKPVMKRIVPLPPPT